MAVMLKIQESNGQKRRKRYIIRFIGSFGEAFDAGLRGAGIINMTINLGIERGRKI
jgi:hypothetical protein